MAYSTMLIVVLGATSAYGEADTKAWIRVLQIITAVVYLVVAHAAVRSLIGKSETNHATT
jgi:type IV secretory pathway VirB2 component (pilin)